MSEYTEEEIVALRAKGKELKIGNFHNMKPENLAIKIKEVEDAPPEGDSDEVAELRAEIAELKDELKALGVKGDVDEPKQWVYHKDDLTGKIVTVKEAVALKKKGWVNTPKDLK